MLKSRDELHFATETVGADAGSHLRRQDLDDDSS
jgi:hypothetical protein